jgi:hypothetical protein
LEISVVAGAVASTVVAAETAGVTGAGVGSFSMGLAVFAGVVTGTGTAGGH